MKICQIVGYKNSGKTTVMKEVIRYFSSRGYKIGSLKHHGHGGEPELMKDTDSYQHFAAGTMASGVQGEHVSQLILNNTEFETLISIYKMLPIDILFIEGYKKADYPKIVLLKNEEELSLLDELSNIIAVGSWDEQILRNVSHPAFSIANIGSYLPQLADYITE
ncbi:molybdopterin-guanine dinucleotide biosynthesis protein B [Virgibacillus oceani]|uniref:Molybdopterin-guanine dinucleotide biosynthesis protein MobB n=1 Tax=Virgibacillus oceani TaxID=1479511 RepID=A0A917M3N0_9BACI|nr:molybdopterin-guanine dinucleotide biosynthesis protein B [Virgibacillus oceani]GGG75427.1 molybdopterin-guanine dinucleotide biosynthesis protein MobB [Virgibacillus oceani]